MKKYGFNLPNGLKTSANTTTETVCGFILLGKVEITSNVHE